MHLSRFVSFCLDPRFLFLKNPPMVPPQPSIHGLGSFCQLPTPFSFTIFPLFSRYFLGKKRRNTEEIPKTQRRKQGEESGGGALDAGVRFAD